MNGRRALILVAMVVVVRGDVSPLTAQVTINRGQRPGKVQGPPPLWDALDRYLRQQFDEGSRGAIRVGFDTAEADRWIAAGGRAAQDRRRVAAAVCAIEATVIRPYLVPHLLAWGRELMARPQPTPTEALWLRTSIAVAEGHKRWSFLMDGLTSEANARANLATAMPAFGHLAYARKRFPDDPHFKMAEVVGAEFLTSPAVAGDGARFQRQVPGFDRLGADALDLAALTAAGQIATLEHAADTLQGLLTVETVRAEAHLRLGYIQLRLGQRDAALRNLDRIDSLTNNPSVRYMGHLFTGLALARGHLVDEAAAAYRAALAVIPHARSATTLLAALLLTNGRLDESEAIAVSFVAQSAEAEDPWLPYFFGDYPLYPNLIWQLRQAVR